MTTEPTKPAADSKAVVVVTPSEALPAAEQLRAWQSLANAPEPQRRHAFERFSSSGGYDALVGKVYPNRGGGAASATAKIAPAKPLAGESLLEALEREIQQITRIAHLEDPVSRRQYEKDQPRLQRLVEQLVALKTGTPVHHVTAAQAPQREPRPARSRELLQAEISKIIALAGTPQFLARQDELDELIQEREGWLPREGDTDVLEPWVPDVPGEYTAQELPPLANGQQRDQIDAELWSTFLARAQAVGVTNDQIDAISEVVVELERKAISRRQAELDKAYEISAKAARPWLAQEYEDVEGRLAAANALLKEILPAGQAKELCHMRFADGTALGANKLFLRLMIEISDRLAELGG